MVQPIASQTPTPLVIAMLLFALALPFAGNLSAVLLSVGVLIPASTLFWFLIKAMARQLAKQGRVPSPAEFKQYYPSLGQQD